MVQYRRWRVEGGYYFFTVTLQNRKSKILTENIQFLQKAWGKVKRRHPFTTVAYVILPDHFHTVWQLPENTHDYATRIRLIKSIFTRQLSSQKSIWQKRYWEHMIRDETDLENHVNYIHYNPVKHGLVKRPIDWPYSSFKSYVDKKIYTVNWSDNEPIQDLRYDAE